MMAEANKNAQSGYYICANCGISIKHEGGKIKRCDKCKCTQFISTDQKIDLSYNNSDFTN
jgi:hypothetical protein